MLKDLAFSELLIAKLCHDLSGGISAISHSIEFIDDANSAMQIKSRELLHGSSTEIMSKLRYYRYAYGISSQDGENDLSFIRTMVEDYFRCSKINLVWQQDYTSGFIAITHKSCKLLVNMILAAANTMIYGGELHIELLNQQGNRVIKVAAEGKNAIKPLPEFKSILADHTQHPMDVHNIQIHLLAKLASSIDVPITSTMNEKCCTITAEIDHS